MSPFPMVAMLAADGLTHRIMVSVIGPGAEANPLAVALEREGLAEAVKVLEIVLVAATWVVLSRSPKPEALVSRWGIALVAIAAGVIGTATNLALLAAWALT